MIEMRDDSRLGPVAGSVAGKVSHIPIGISMICVQGKGRALRSVLISNPGWCHRDIHPVVHRGVFVTADHNTHAIGVRDRDRKVQCDVSGPVNHNVMDDTPLLTWSRNIMNYRP